jgi:glycosyltransferase involved in cell wall biosynthesis
MTLPVLATNYSGPTELLRPENAYAIGYSGPAADGKVQPHVHELRGAMRRVYTHPAKARAKGQQARRDILAQYDPAAVAATVASRLQRIVADHLGAVPPPQPPLGRL